ncbi:MAG: hypothetical protein AAGD14_01310 [Planctomycetota bacterium]
MRLRHILSIAIVLLVATTSSAEPDLTTRMGVAYEWVAASRDLAAVLEGMKDEKTIKAARPAMLKIAKRMAAVLAAAEKLGEPEGEEKKKIEARLAPALNKINKRTWAAMQRLRADAKLWALFEPLLEEYSTLQDPKAAKRERMDRRIEKTNHLRDLFGRLMKQKDGLPMKDGALDVYALVRSGDVTAKEYHFFRIPENRLHPTAKEIEKGDYTNFPYERYRGDGNIQVAKLIPLLWEKKPDADGKFMVLTNDGSVKAMDKAELAKLLAKK